MSEKYREPILFDHYVEARIQELRDFQRAVHAVGEGTTPEPPRHWDLKLLGYTKNRVMQQAMNEESRIIGGGNGTVDQARRVDGGWKGGE